MHDGPMLDSTVQCCERWKDRVFANLDMSVADAFARTAIDAVEKCEDRRSVRDHDERPRSRARNSALLCPVTSREQVMCEMTPTCHSRPRSDGFAASRAWVNALVAAASFVTLDVQAARGGYSKPYALFEPQRKMQVADTRPAFIVKIDGHSVAIDRSEPVPPGVRTIVVSIPGAKGMSNPSRATVEVDAKPCMRYYLAARRSSPTARDWSPFVAAAEPIGECVRRFPSN